MSVTAPITNISRGSLHDGPGVRTVVYFKGCGLRCQWCHNPETLSARKEILYMPSKCIHCGKCVELCPEHHVIRENNMHFLREGCTACGKCAKVCPSLALSLCGEEKTVEEVFEELKKDAHFYASSGGGVTLSGGECLLQAEFVGQLAEMCRKNGIHTAVESALFVPWENIERVLPHIDLFLADLKIADREKHTFFTGKPNDRILDNLSRLSRSHNNIVLRIPVIPGVNDSTEDMEKFAAIIRGFGDGIREIELLKYNGLAESKYGFVGRSYTKFAEESQTDEEMRVLDTQLRKFCGGKA